MTRPLDGARRRVSCSPPVWPGAPVSGTLAGKVALVTGAGPASGKASPAASPPKAPASW
ncbi:hypothetical protein I552_5564 [Mycobacterium xenopi 3993]|nr:hypothetical protein I552_5564 [Mycobacterium xenopi 3993]